VLQLLVLRRREERRPRRPPAAHRVLRSVLPHPASQKLEALDTLSLGASGWHKASEEEGVSRTGEEEMAYAERGAARQKGRREEGRWSAAGDREAKGIAIY